MGKKVVLYGAGDQNLRMALIFLYTGGYTPEFVVDKNPQKWGDTKNNISVVSPQRLREFDQQEREQYDLLITIRSQKVIEEVRESLDELKNANICTVTEFVAKKKIFSNRKAIGVLVMHLADHCNLNCVRCSHLSPLVTEEIFYDKNQFKKDIEKISEITGGKILELQFGGGEPLLNKDCIYYLELARKNFPDSRILLMTNGILLRNVKEDFLEACRENKIIISITRYGINISINDIVEKLEKEYVQYELADEGDWRNGKPKQMEKCVVYDLDGNQEMKNAYENCVINNSTNMRNGVVYQCSNAAYSHYFNSYFGTELPDFDSVGVNMCEVSSYEELLRKLSEPTKMCRYCRVSTGFSSEFYNPIDWKISERKIDEWT